MVTKLFIAEWRSHVATFRTMMPGSHRRATPLIPLRCAGIVLALLALGGVAHAVTITVNSLADPGTSGICVLRDAITAANTKTVVNGCAAGSGNDTIVFSVTGLITLGADLPAIVNTLTIQGPAANPPGITVGGALLHQVMSVNAGATVNLAYLTIENGTPSGLQAGNGGGVENQGTLSVTNSTFSGNTIVDGQGGGIYNTGTLTVTTCTFSGNNAQFGGGIANLGTLTVTGSTFTSDFGNPDGEGGGIGNDGTATVSNSTFAGDSAEGPGGAIENGGTLTVTNSTFDDDSAEGPGGAIDNGGTLTVINTTFSGNSGVLGGGIANRNFSPEFPGTADVKGTILTASTGGNCATGQFVEGITDDGFNLDDDGTCGFASGTTSDADIALDPKGLQNNGGPTETIALEPGSVAAHAIPVASCQYVNVNPCTNPPTTSASGPLVCDQRSEPRPGSGESACAIGAFEPQTLTEFAEFDTGLIVFPNQFAAGGSSRSAQMPCLIHRRRP